MRQPEIKLNLLLANQMTMFNHLFAGLLFIFICSCSTGKFSKRDVQKAQKVLGLEFEKERIDTMFQYLKRNQDGYDSLRSYSLPPETFPAILFDPRPTGFEYVSTEDRVSLAATLSVQRPDDLNDLAFFTVRELSQLVKERKVTSLELTELYLQRIKKYDPVLKSVITLTEELALELAKKADIEIANGQYKGPLHGIPFGTKDLMSLKGYKTTWGARPFKNQMIDHTATVIQKLQDAGAVHIAKLSSGALARGDVWFDGKTKNPWDINQGASGSSAGPGAATAAGLVGFSLGTETLGSITSPSNRNGVTGHRPTYGTVSRDGVMSLSWSMDKVGPICRSAEDCALVYDVINGKDKHDQTTVESGFQYHHDLDITKLKVAYLKVEIDRDTTEVGDNIRSALKVLEQSGVSPDSISLPEDFPYSAFDIILRAESGAMFDYLVRSGSVDLMVQQGQRSRANSLRQSRFIPAVEYLQANRFRRLLIDRVHEIFKNYDIIIAPTFGGRQLLITNLTGHPVVTVPSGFDKRGHPTSLTFIGNLYQDGVVLEFANAFQKMTNHHRKHPELKF